MKRKKVTITDVARLAGFSASTVSHVINNTRFVEKKTKDKILAAIENLNYRPNILAQSLKGKGTKTLGLIISDIREGFFSEIIKSIEINANMCGYNVILCDSEESSEKEKFYIDVLLRKGVDGLIFAPVNTKIIFKDILSSMIPSVQIDRKLQHHKADFVGIDNIKSAEIATHYLYDQGYKNVGFVGYSENIYTMEKRIKGYKNAVLKRGDLKESSIKVLSHNGINMKDTIKEWLGGYGKIDAILCANDNICYEALSAIEETGLQIPHDIGIISFDDPKWFRFLKSPITAIRQPTWKMGELSVDLLIDRIKHESKNKFKDLLLDTELVIRKSCRRNI